MRTSMTGLMLDVWRVVGLGELSHADDHQWRLLLSGRLQELVAPGPGPVADRFSYRISCPECDVDVEIVEAVLPEPVLGLFQRTLRG